MNPKKLELAERGYELAAQRKDIEQWQLGIYFSNALVSTVGNMFRGKGKAPNEYPKEPLFAYKQLPGKGNEEMEEAEKDKQIDALFTQLNIMSANWNLEQNRKKKREAVHNVK